MRTTTLTFGSCLVLAACGGKGNTSDSSSGGGSSSTGSSSTGEVPTTGGSTGDGTSSTTASMTASSDPTTGPSQTASSDPTTGPAPTTGGTDPGETTGTNSDTSGSSDETGVQPSGDAVAENDCAPNDGPAVVIKLEVAEGVCGAGWPGDQLRIGVFQGAPLPAGTYMLGDNIGFATLQIGMDEPMFTNEGSLTIESFTDELVTGTYELTFPDNTMRAGAFTGPFCMTMPMCG